MIRGLLQVRDEHDDAWAWLKWTAQHHAEKPWSSLSSLEHIWQALEEVKKVRRKWSVLFSAFLQQIERSSK